MKDYKKTKRVIARVICVIILVVFAFALFNPIHTVIGMALWLNIILLFAWLVFDEKEDKQDKNQKYKRN